MSLPRLAYTFARAPADDDAPNVALALDAFMAEHRGCWRLHGEGLESDYDGLVVWLVCSTCDAIAILPKDDTHG